MRKTHIIAVASLLGALAALSELIPGPPFDIPFPLYSRISWDLTGIPIMISQLMYGPITAIYTTLIGCSIIFLRGNLYGGIFKIIAELATVLGYALLRKTIFERSFSAIASRVLVMTVANYYLLQMFYGIPESAVMSLLPVIGIFNATQVLINVIPAHIVCQRILKLREQIPKEQPNIKHT
jgi:riboflavin transporter FmnP